MSMRVGLSVIVVLLWFGGPRWAQAEDAPNLIERLSDKKKSVRLDALRQLGKLGSAGKSAAPTVGKLLRDSDEADVVAQAAATLAQLGPAGAPELVRTIKDARIQHVRHVTAALARMGPAARSAIPALIEALKDHDPAVRGAAAQALGEAGDQSDDVILALFERILDPALPVRQKAGLSILRAGAKAVPGLQRILRDGKASLRIEAAGLVGRLGSDGAAAVSDLLNAFEDPVPELRAAAALALGGIGSKAKEALPRLLEGLAREKHPLVQQHCFQAVMQIGNKDVPGFMDQLGKINREGNWVAPFVLVQFGPRAKDGIKPLVKMLADKDQTMRLGAVLALGQIGTDAVEAMPAVYALLKDPYPMVRGAAAQTLARIDPRQEALAQKQFLAALEQMDRQLIAVEKRLAKVPLPKIDLRPIDHRAFFDPRVQAPYRQIMHVHLLISADKIKPDAFKVDPGALIERFEPEAIPALLEGINQAIVMRLGFC